MVHASKTLIFPRNRGNGMLEISHVSEQVDEISQASFSLHEVLQACGVRMPPKGSDERKEIERMNEELVAAAHGHLAPVVRDDAEIMVTGCSHNSAGLKAIHAVAKCNVDRISEKRSLLVQHNHWKMPDLREAHQGRHSILFDGV